MCSNALWVSRVRHMRSWIQLSFLAVMYLAGREFGLGLWYQLGLGVAAGLCAYHQYLIRERDPAACFRAFRHNNWVGLAIFAGIVLHYTL